jgi:tRNA A58 N-methylase Trm61
MNSYFSHVADHFRAGALKSFMDPVFVIVEKIAGKFEAFAHYYLSMYDEMIDQEIILANITDCDKILVIGCGSVPATSILLAKKTDAQIIALDHDESAIIKAKDIINWFDVEKNITLVFAEGMDYPVDDFSVVIISYGIKEPETIIRHLKENISSNCRIIYRTAVDIQEGSSKGFIDLEGMFTVKDSILSSSFSSVISYLLISKQEK